MHYKVAKVILSINLDKEFDYSITGDVPKIGSRVLVDFNGKKQVGLIVGLSNTSNIKNLKPILEILSKEPVLRREQILFAKKLSKKYFYPFGEFLFMMLPSYLRKNKKTFFSLPLESIKKQQPPLKTFIKADTFLERYELWKDIVAKKITTGSVLICFPQISHLEYAEKIIEKDFNGMVKIFHSQKKEKELFFIWRNSREKSLILGTRMAIFYYPLDLELIVIEEENSHYYFQEEKPYYHLLNVAFLLSEIKKIDLILSADYPTLYTYKLIEENKIFLKEKTKQKDIEVVNISYNNKNSLSPLLEELIQKTILENKKVILLFNRKGYAQIAKCLGCGYILNCKYCFSFLQLSFNQHLGICPYCGRKWDLPEICPKCNLNYIRGLGLGIEKLKLILRKSFPKLQIDSLEERTENTDIILSTSKILSSLHQKTTSTVGFLYDTDLFLSKPDYEATFNTFIYINKLASFFEKTYVFTHNKNHHLFNNILRWKNFYDEELSLRKQFHLPPYGSISKIIIRGKNENKVFEKINNLFNRLKDKVEIYGPFKEQPFKLYGKFYYTVIIKSKKNHSLYKLLKEEIKKIRSSAYKVAIIIKQL